VTRRGSRYHLTQCVFARFDIPVVANGHECTNCCFVPSACRISSQFIVTKWTYISSLTLWSMNVRKLGEGEHTKPTCFVPGSYPKQCSLAWVFNSVLKAMFVNRFTQGRLRFDFLINLEFSNSETKLRAPEASELIFINWNMETPQKLLCRNLGLRIRSQDLLEDWGNITKRFSRHPVVDPSRYCCFLAGFWTGLKHPVPASQENTPNLHYKNHPVNVL
jgi:hypothetical protein